MENDDSQRGVILSRRDALKILGVAGASLLAGCTPGLSGTQPAPLATVQPASATPAGSLPACIVRPELTEGPYYVDEELNRSDIRSDPTTGVIRPGLPLSLAFVVSQVANGTCSPLAGAKVDVWHCDAAGVYSDVSDPGFDTKGQKFLRGYQLTDANGRAEFLTIYPGWYSGRTVHIHFKIAHGTPGQAAAFTSQLFFDDALSDQVFSQPPYASRGPRDTLNGRDGIFNDQLVLKAIPANAGYAATFSIGLDM
jgi:protocatechuate 3,4-dioxygenase beta subunit